MCGFGSGSVMMSQCRGPGVHRLAQIPLITWEDDNAHSIRGSRTKEPASQIALFGHRDRSAPWPELGWFRQRR